MSWFGHQSWFVRGRPALGVGDGMTGFSLSLPGSDTSVLRYLTGCSDGWWLSRVLGSAPAVWCTAGTAPVDDLGLVDREAVVVGGGQARARRRRRSRRRRSRRRTGRRGGGGCRRPGPRSAPPSPPAGCAGSGPRRSGPEDVVHRLVGDLAEALPHQPAPPPGSAPGPAVERRSRRQTRPPYPRSVARDHAVGNGIDIVVLPFGEMYGHRRHRPARDGQPCRFLDVAGHAGIGDAWACGLSH